MTDEPTADDRPTDDHPTTAEPMTDDAPATDGPASDDTVTGEPASEDATTDRPVTDDPGTDAYATDGGASNEPVTDSGASNEPATDGGASNEPGASDPVADDPGGEAASRGGSDERTTATDWLADVDVEAYLYRGTLVLLVLFAVTAAFQAYISASRAIDVWISPDFAPVFQAGFNVVVLLAAVIGISLLLRRMGE